MFKKFIPPYKKIFFLFILLFSLFFFHRSLITYSANSENLPEISLEELKQKPVTTIEDKVGDLLRQWYEEGTAAGNVGDYYDNRDRGHSHLKMEDYPQLQKIKYSREERKQKIDWAVQTRLLPYVVFGNSSTSAGILNGGSNVRTYYVNPGGMSFLYGQYTHNNLYIYPAHRDYIRGDGDVFPTNSPYLIASKGSSGSDRKYMNAVAQTLAAFRPEVKKKLIDTGFLMPTIQMILRYAAAGGWQNYMEGEVQRVAGIKVDNLKMIETAHNLQINEIPPLVQLKVLEEDEPLNGEDFFAPGESIKLADTPCVIARIFRGKSYWHRMVVSAEGSIDLYGRDLSYRWKVLQGDRKKISVKPLNDAGSVVEIKIPYHERQPIINEKYYASNRVDIGVFVKAGKSYSAPGFITSFSLDNEARTYDDERILEIGYGMGENVMEIADWNDFFMLSDPDNDSTPASILRSQFSRLEIDLINRVADEYRDAATAIESTEKELDNKERPDINELQKKLRMQKREEQNLIAKKKRGQEYSINDLAVHALNNLIDDPEFINTYNSYVIKCYNAASEENKSAFVKELNRLEHYGILKKQHNFTIEITPIRNGSNTLKKRLTGFEYAQLKKLNATALSSLFFPGIVESSFEVNFVDQRLVIPKFWRDVYHYSKTGQPIGWTRFSDAGRTEFNKDGLIKLESDSQGRCIKGQTVVYRQDPPEHDSQGKRFWLNENPVKWTLGKEIWYYQFADNSDWLGKVVKIEKIN